MKTLWIFFISFSLTGCAWVDINDYENTLPKLELKTFFQGKIKASGVVESFTGKVLRKFNVDMKASWQGQTLTLDEHFIYDDGELQHRVWIIEDLGNGHYTGKADDIIGIAKGQAKGSALRWQYQMWLLFDDDEYKVTFDDWMFLINEHTIINRTKIKKFGISVAEVTLIIQRVVS